MMKDEPLSSSFRHRIKRVLFLGMGYVADHFAHLLRARGFDGVFYGTYHHHQERARARGDALMPCHLLPSSEIASLDETHDTHHENAGLADTLLLLSAPPVEAGDPFALTGLPSSWSKRIAWMAYLSTTGVYGGENGEMITETSPKKSTLTRARQRLIAEGQWEDYAKKHEISLRIFRLAGIYGPGRNVLEKIREGKATRIMKKGQIFSRIHVYDIALTLLASVKQTLEKGDCHTVQHYNVCDEQSAPACDVLSYGAGLLGMPPPVMIPYEDAVLSPMAKTFYQHSQRISNAYVKEHLGIVLRYKTYREGLLALA